mgnify:CR=1 FL=1
MHYCIQKIYHVYYTKQWNFIILRKFIHMTLASPNEKWMRVADIVRRFCHFLFMKERICFDVVGNFELKQNDSKLQCIGKIDYYIPLTIHLFFLDSVKQWYLQTKKHAVTSSERAHSITWYKQKRRHNRWASKQVSRRYTYDILGLSPTLPIRRSLFNHSSEKE